MTAATNAGQSQRDGSPSSVPTAKIIMWAVLFQIAWFWKKLPLLQNEGAMPDTDDFQRLSQVRNWMGGQSWYDLLNHRMDPPTGGDIHWSRLVDVPIAMIAWLFRTVLDPVLAERAAAVVWPMLLLVATVLVVLAICRRLEPDANPLLALLFTVTCITALTEFMPGRIDHHGIQILLFCLMLLGVVMPRGGWGPVLFGAAAAISISVGLDAIMIIVFLFGWLGAGWVFGCDPLGKGLSGAALGLVATAPAFYLLNFAPISWFEALCDANSAFYFTGLMLVAGAYGLLWAGSRKLSVDRDPGATIRRRFVVGTVTGGGAIVLLLLLYPQCAGGPFADLPEDLKSRWLANVGEARGLFDQLEKSPTVWFWGVFYSSLMVCIGAFVTWRRFRERPEILALFAVLVISVAASIIQYRSLRIGIFAAIPFCVFFIEMVFARVRQSALSSGLRAIIQFTAVLALASPTWLAIGVLAFPDKDTGKNERGQQQAEASGEKGWRVKEPHIFCNKQSEFAELAALPSGYAMTDIDSGPATLVFTDHTVVGGPYHRNARAIIDIADFFETDEAKAREVAIRRKFDYVAWCEDIDPLDAELRNNPALAVRIRLGEEPQWLERVSSPGARLHLFKVRLD